MDLAVDGRTVHIATGGRPFTPERPAVIFLHGAGMDHTVWALQARYLAHRGRAVAAVDLPGHGRSAGPALDSIAALAAWVERLLAALAVSSAALVGHSMGALIALEAAAALGPRTRALVLLGAAPRMPVHPDLLAAAAADDHRACDLVTAWGHGPTGHLGGSRAPGVWLMGAAERLLERAAPGVLYRDLAACNAYPGAQAAAQKIACPCLVIAGALDRMTPARAGRALVEMIPDARLSLIPEAGHMMMLEKPDETLDALRTLL